MAEAKLTAEQLRQLFRYDPQTGSWTHLMARQRVQTGTVAGSPFGGGGYHRISVNSRGYLGHRLAWLYMTGEWPRGQIDHIDGDRSNNAWVNLRLATNGQNKANSCLPRNNTSGFKGVHRTHRGKPWRAKIVADGRKISLGSFDDPQSAHAAYARAAEKYFGQFARAS